MCSFVDRSLPQFSLIQITHFLFALYFITYMIGQLSLWLLGGNDTSTIIVINDNEYPTIWFWRC